MVVVGAGTVDVCVVGVETVVVDVAVDVGAMVEVVVVGNSVEVVSAVC